MAGREKCSQIVKISAVEKMAHTMPGKVKEIIRSDRGVIIRRNLCVAFNSQHNLELRPKYDCFRAVGIA